MAYEKHTWTAPELITKEKLNNIEDGVEEALEGIGELASDVEEISGDIAALNNGRMLSGNVKQALLDIFDHLVYTDGNAQDYIQALKNAWAVTPAPDAFLTATFTPSGAIYDSTRLRNLRQYLQVKMWHDDITEDVADYELSGRLVAGTVSTITVSYANLTTAFNVNVALPADYQQVEYVGSNGGCQCLRFGGIKPREKADLAKWEIEIDCQLTGWDENAATNMIFSYSSNGGGWFGYNNSVGKLALGTTSGMYFNDNKTYDRHQFQYYVENDVAYVSREDGATISRAVTWTSGGFTYLNLFGNNVGTQYMCKCNVYSFKIYQDGELYASLVPCYRKSDGEIGFYDVARKIFCTNSGTDAFIKGSDV